MIMGPRAHLDESGAVRIERGTRIDTLLAQCVESVHRFVSFVRGAERANSGDYVITDENRGPMEELWHNMVLFATLPMMLASKATAKPRLPSGRFFESIDPREFAGRAGLDHPFPRDVYSALRAITLAWPAPHGDNLPEDLVNRLDHLAEFLEEATRQPVLVLREDCNVTVNGETVVLTPDQWKCLKVIVEGNGGFVSSDDIRRVHDAIIRPDRVIKRMPKSVSDLIERKRGTGGGYRIDPAALT